MTHPGNGRRFAAVPLTTPGTPAQSWIDWLRGRPVLDVRECPALVVVAPHPDDETLGLGAMAAMVRARGIEVTVLELSNGGAAYPELSRLERVWLERDRRAEVLRATARLGVAEPLWLNLPDGDLAAHHDAMVEAIGDVLSGRPAGAWCAATWRGDGHPDHEAAGRAAAEAAARSSARLLEFPVWTWHWALPGDAAVPWETMSTVPHDRTAFARKQEAVKEFRSQLHGPDATTEPGLPDFVVRRLLAVGEVVFG